MRALVFASSALLACSSALEAPVVLVDAATTDSAPTTDAALPNPTDATSDSTADVGKGCFEKTGAWGVCETTTACAALGNRASTPGLCQGAEQCCAPVPRVSDNPAVPNGYKLMSQSGVTPAMTTWAVAILHDPVTYPMFSTTTQTFGAQIVLARVEWHPPDFQNSIVHRGVTLYVPI